MPELRLLRARILFPEVDAIPAHLGPISIAMLRGAFNRRPHFLHFDCLSIVTSWIEYSSPGVSPGLLSFRKGMLDSVSLTLSANDSLIYPPPLLGHPIRPRNYLGQFRYRQRRAWNRPTAHRRVGNNHFICKQRLQFVQDGQPEMLIGGKQETAAFLGILLCHHKIIDALLDSFIFVGVSPCVHHMPPLS